MANEVRDVPFGEALKISLDHYYNLLKTSVGSLAAEEFLQLKLVADPLDISEEKYKFFSYYGMLNRSDLAVEPVPVAGEIVTSAATLHSVFGRFLQRLRTFVVRSELSAEEQAKVAELDVELERIRSKQLEYFRLDAQMWREYCEIRGTPVGDSLAYFQWSSRYGYIGQIEELSRQQRQSEFDRRTILNRQYSNPADREIVDAEADFENPGMRLRYPIHPDNEYNTPFTLEYLANLPLGSTALFDDRRAVTWNQSLSTIKTAQQGSFNAVFDKNTGASSSITTDWNASGSAGWWFLKVRASVSDHRQITEDFKKSTSITLGSQAAFRVNILYPQWFRPTLFRHPRVMENLRDFADFFGPTGALRYYPTALILVRGFKVVFDSQQAWTYDYARSFSASAGGGFSIFGVNFGGTTTYGKNVAEHKFDRSNTKLTIEDAADTVRFVGLAVKRNAIVDDFVPVSDAGHGAQVYDLGSRKP